MTASPRDAAASTVRTSSFCTDGSCLGVVFSDRDITVVDTKTSRSLRFTASEWEAFVAGVKSGEFDRP